MAKKNKLDDKKINYAAELRRLKEEGPERLYLLWGPEDYLREQYLNELKGICLPEGEDSFSFKRIDGPELDERELEEALDTMPFLSDRSFVEIRGVDLNRLKEAEKILKLLTDIPDYCTVAFVQSAQFEPDGRLKIIKAIRDTAKELLFSPQSVSLLTGWIARRFSAVGKSIELDAIQRLIFVSGDLMNRLIPEIEKVAAYAKGDKITVADVDAVASHIPDADIFEMTDLIAQGKINSALSVLAELLSDRKNEPIMMLGSLGAQMRKLYAARLAIDNELGTKYIMENCSIKYEFVAKKLLSAARGYSLDRLIRALDICVETDYRMKSSGGDNGELLKEAVLRIAVGES